MENLHAGIGWIQLDIHRELLELSKHTPESAFVLTQVKFLIYSKGGPIDYDLRYIGNICNGMRPSTCRKQLDRLVQLGAIFLTDDGKIYSQSCHETLEKIGEFRKKRREIAKIGAEARWGNQQNQSVNNATSISHELPKQSNQHSNEKNQNSYLLDRQKFDIDEILTDQSRDSIRREMQGYDFQALMRDFNEKVRSGEISYPDKPIGYFTVFCRSQKKS